MKSWVIGNWKLNPVSTHEVRQLVNAITTKTHSFNDCHIMIAPSFVHLPVVKSIVEDTTLKLASQDVSALARSKGAYTGDVSAEQLKDVGVEWVIIGHSERRQYYKESNEELFEKMIHCLANDLGIVFCIGESESDYNAGQTQKMLVKQLDVIQSLVTTLSKTDEIKLIIAYEPVWAIGTGKVPSVGDVAQVHTFIRDFLADCHVDLMTLPIIYGGSVKSDNALSFAECADVNGVLVGGAALDAESFVSIAKSFDTAIPSS